MGTKGKPVIEKKYNTQIAEKNLVNLYSEINTEKDKINL
jgi:hypothetical protein